jgi:hypothetical protein
MRLEFSRQIFENTQIADFIKIRPVGAELFNVYGRSNGHDEGQFFPRNFANAPKKAVM